MLAWLPKGIAAVSGYECVALASDGRLPTISALLSRNHRAAWVLAGVLLVHVYRYPACKVSASPGPSSPGHGRTARG